MEKKIKVLHVLTVFNTGGLEMMIMNFFRNIDRSRFQFDFLVQREEGFYESEAIGLGGTIHRISKLSYSPISFFNYLLDLKKFFKENRYDIVHVHTNSFGFFPLYFAKKNNIEVRISHCNISDLRDQFLKIQIGKFLNRKIVSVASDLVACSQDAGNWMYGPNPFSIIPNAIDSESFKFQPSVRAELQSDLTSNKTLNFIHVGRFNEQKNHIFLIDVFAEICSQEKDVHLFLIGEGDLRNTILDRAKTKNIADRITFLGVRSDVNNIMQAMDIFIFPSLFEGLGIAYIEAQASGLACFISDAIPQEAILIPELTLVLSLSKSPKHWAEQILSFSEYERKDQSDKIKAAGYDIVESTRNLERKYTSLLQKSKN